MSEIGENEMVRGEYGVIEMDRCGIGYVGYELKLRCRRYGNSFSFMDRTNAREGKGKAL